MKPLIIYGGINLETGSAGSGAGGYGGINTETGSAGSGAGGYGGINLQIIVSI
jgi:hypothetical protein